ncbi:unnamed protein product [Diatraea saccharalis]|uniref:MORN repeat-containing protein 5 n=1 Tax=Diatraea saccharalis TaxID=40085 RepID=A0A9N9R1U5_9NEOP|nr:unnamed protein product [Diatraea saccharalis]
MFHGDGELRYPCGAILRGKWRRGSLIERTLVFADNLEYSETDWKYCRMPDRRFTIEYEKGLQPAGQSFLTAEQPTRDIPPGFYDTGDGFYDPKTKVVYKADDLTAILRSPSVREKKWIMENCRMCPEKEVGPRPDLYEEWSKPTVVPEQSPESVNNTPRARSKNEVVRNSSDYPPPQKSICKLHSLRGSEGSGTSSTTSSDVSREINSLCPSDGDLGDISSLSIYFSSDTSKTR